MSTCTGVPTGMFIGCQECQAHGDGGGAGFDGDGARENLQVDLRCVGRRIHEVAGSTDLNPRGVGQRNRCDDFESRWIDDAQHRIAGGCFDQIAGIVVTLGDDPVEGRSHNRAAFDRLRRAKRRACLGDGRLCVGHRSIRFLDVPARGDAPVEQLARARLRRLRVVRARPQCVRLRPAVSGLRPSSDGISKRTSTSPVPNAIAARARDLRDARRLRRDDDEVCARRRDRRCPWRARHPEWSRAWPGPSSRRPGSCCQLLPPSARGTPRLREEQSANGMTRQ